MKEISCFMSSHGYGHAMRMTAILEQLVKHIPDLHPHLFTTLPRSLFTPPLHTFHLHRVNTDIGLVQNNAIDINISTTVSQLDDILPYRNSWLQELAQTCQNSSLVLCDISPLGIAVAKLLGIPSVLVENFTWDWIYQPYFQHNKRLQAHADYLKGWFADADFHIKTEPLCQPGSADLHCGPIFRQIQNSPETVRKQLDFDDRQIVLISMGGIQQDLSYVEKLQTLSQYQFICAGQRKTKILGDNVFLLDRTTNIYHPDLINTADLVISKSGYSTIAECYQAGTPLACISRSIFPESEVLESFIKQHHMGTILPEDDFYTGEWVTKIKTLLEASRIRVRSKNGASEVARFLVPLFL